VKTKEIKVCFTCCCTS